MDLKIDLKHFVPKQTYMRNGIKHFLDPYRQMLVPLTQENLLLYKMESYAVQVMGVPKAMVYAKQSFRKYGMDSSKVIDLVIHDEINGEVKPVAIVECKSISLKLCHTTTSHIEDFAKKNKVNYLIVTNGSEVDSYISREDRLSFWKIDNIPDYETIRKSYVTEEDQENSAKTSTPVKAKKASAQKFSSKKTPTNIQPIVMNWMRALNKESDKFAHQTFGGISIVGDCGLRKKLTGFGSDKIQNVIQRTFLIKDFVGNHQLVSLDIAPDSSGAPILSVTIDDVDNRQVVLALDLTLILSQDEKLTCMNLNLKDYFKRENFDFNNELKQLIKERAPHLLDENKIGFGCWENDSTIEFSNSNFKEILIQVISFAVILDEHRANQKSKEKGTKSNK